MEEGGCSLGRSFWVEKGWAFDFLWVLPPSKPPKALGSYPRVLVSLVTCGAVTVPRPDTMPDADHSFDSKRPLASDHLSETLEPLKPQKK